MSRWYSRIWEEMATSKLKIIEDLCSGPFIFVPCLSSSSSEDTVSGILMSVEEVHWHDSIVSMNQAESFHPKCDSDVPRYPFSKALCNVYPELRDFFVKECGVNENPPLRSYLEILLHLSTIMLPSQAAREVFQVFVRWADGLQSGSLCSGDIEYLKDNLLRKEYTVLPTAQDKWVSLHPSFGLVYWCDDDTLQMEFKSCNDIVFLYFGELTEEEKQVSKERISTLMHRLGIPALSKVITREAIYYGPMDNSFIASLVEWALPYAQRFIYNVHPDNYLQLKQSGFHIPICLRIIVVEKLFCRNVLKGSHLASKRRSECSSLLQGNILYAARESDYHSLYMELSRLLYDGNPELHLANFLHMITIMAESGSTEEQMEIFILNSQKVPKLPAEESVWSLSTVSSSAENDEALIMSTTIEGRNSKKFKKKTGINSNWPPVGWKTAPRFNLPHVNLPETRAAWSLPTTINHDLEGTTAQREYPVPTECTMEGDKVPSSSAAVSLESEALGYLSEHVSNNMEGDKVPSSSAAVLLESEAFEYLSEHVSSIVAPDTTVGPDSVDASNSCEREQLCFGTTNAKQAMLTGRIGELVAFKYFVENAGKILVKWVNEVNETGLPYDIVIGDEEESKEYIEVKSTKSAKDWFAISVKEWQFAVDKGESFSIARIVLKDNKLAAIKIYKNPVRLCQLGELQLGVLIPKQMES